MEAQWELAKMHRFISGVLYGVALITPAACGEGAEIFHLRGECAKLGDSLEDKKKIEMNKISKTADPVVVVATSNYNVVSNRCYVLIAYTFIPEMFVRYTLYDGQSSENAIASCSRGEKKPKYAFIGDDSVSTEVACDYIGTMMSRFPR